MPNYPFGGRQSGQAFPLSKGKVRADWVKVPVFTKGNHDSTSLAPLCPRIYDAGEVARSGAFHSVGTVDYERTVKVNRVRSNGSRLRHDNPFKRKPKGELTRGARQRSNRVIDGPVPVAAVSAVAIPVLPWPGVVPTGTRMVTAERNGVRARMPHEVFVVVAADGWSLR